MLVESVEVPAPLRSGVFRVIGEQRRNVPLGPGGDAAQCSGGGAGMRGKG